MLHRVQKERKMDEENGTLLSDSTVNQREPQGWKAIAYILGNETFERVWTLGLPASFMVYMVTEFHMDQVKAATIVNIWAGATNFAPIFGALISDAFIGKFRTIAIGSFAALLGMMMVTLTALVPQLHPPPCTLEQQEHGQCRGYTNAQLSVLILGLFWIAVGTGGIRSCSIPFSVDQFNLSTAKGRSGIASFYNFYYTIQTILLLIFQTLVVYIQNDISWALGFGLPTICMFCAIILLLVGTKLFIYVKPEGSIFSGIAQVFVAAHKKRWLKLPADEDGNKVFYDLPLKRALLSNKKPLTNQFGFLNKAAIITGNEVKPDGYPANPWRLCSIQQIEDVKCLIRTVPICVSSIISFLALNQQLTFAISQALKMDLHIGSKYQIPASSLSVIPFITVAIWLIIDDGFIVPQLEKITKQEGGITLLKKVGIGNMFAILTMLLSGLVETKRRDLAISRAGPDGVAPMSAMWLVPQLVLIGYFQAYGIVGLIEFYNNQFPNHMRSIGNSLVYIILAAASYVNSLVITIVHNLTGKDGQGNWLTEDVNTSKLHYFYFLIAGLTTLNFIFFMFCAHRYRYRSM